MVGVEQCFLQQVPHMPTLGPVQNSPSLPGALDETSKAELGKVLTGDRRPAATAANVATSDSPWRNSHRIRSLVGIGRHGERRHGGIYLRHRGLVRMRTGNRWGFLGAGTGMELPYPPANTITSAQMASRSRTDPSLVPGRR